MQMQSAEVITKQILHLFMLGYGLQPVVTSFASIALIMLIMMMTIGMRHSIFHTQILTVFIPSMFCCWNQ